MSARFQTKYAGILWTWDDSMLEDGEPLWVFSAVFTDWLAAVEKCHYPTTGPLSAWPATPQKDGWTVPAGMVEHLEEAAREDATEKLGDWLKEQLEIARDEAQDERRAV